MENLVEKVKPASKWIYLSDSDPESNYPDSEPENELNFFNVAVVTPATSTGTPDSTVSRNKMSDSVSLTLNVETKHKDIGCQTTNTVPKRWDGLQAVDKTCQTNRIKINRHKITRSKTSQLKTSHPNTKRIKNDRINLEIADWYETKLEIEKLADINNNKSFKKVECEIKNALDAKNQKLRQDSLEKYSRIIEIQENKIDAKSEENRKLMFEMDELKSELKKIKQLYDLKSAGERFLQIECNSYKHKLAELQNGEKESTCAEIQTEKRTTTNFGTQTESFEGKIQVETCSPRVVIRTRSQTSSPSKTSPWKKHVHFSNERTFENPKKPYSCEQCVSLKKCELELSRAENDLVEAQVYGKKMLLQNIKLQKLNEEKTITKESSILSSEFSNF